MVLDRLKQLNKWEFPAASAEPVDTIFEHNDIPGTDSYKFDDDDQLWGLTSNPLKGHPKKQLTKSAERKRVNTLVGRVAAASKNWEQDKLVKVKIMIVMTKKNSPSPADEEITNLPVHWVACILAVRCRKKCWQLWMTPNWWERGIWNVRQWRTRSYVTIAGKSCKSKLPHTFTYL